MTKLVKVKMIRQWATAEHNVGPKTVVAVRPEVAEELVKGGAAVRVDEDSQVEAKVIVTPEPEKVEDEDE